MNANNDLVGKREGDGLWSPMPVCVDVDECADSTTCPTGFICVNTVGAYICMPRVKSVGGTTTFTDMDGDETVQVTVEFPNM